MLYLKIAGGKGRSDQNTGCHGGSTCRYEQGISESRAILGCLRGCKSSVEVRRLSITELEPILAMSLFSALVWGSDETQ